MLKGGGNDGDKDDLEINSNTNLKDLKEVLKMKIELAKLNRGSALKSKKQARDNKSFKKSLQPDDNPQSDGNSDGGSDSSGDGDESEEDEESSDDDDDIEKGGKAGKKKRTNKKVESRPEDIPPKLSEMLNKDKMGWRAFFKTSAGKTRLDRVERYEDRLCKAFEQTRQSWETTWF